MKKRKGIDVDDIGFHDKRNDDDTGYDGDHNKCYVDDAKRKRMDIIIKETMMQAIKKILIYVRLMMQAMMDMNIKVWAIMQKIMFIMIIRKIMMQVEMDIMIKGKMII